MVPVSRGRRRRRAACAAALLCGCVGAGPEISPVPLDPPPDLRRLGLAGLHVGCGLGLMPGALNTDIAGISAATGATNARQPLVRVDISPTDQRYFLQHDAATPFPLPPGTFSWIYSEHFLEHIPRRAAVAFLAEARRLLPARGGVIRLSTPDLAVYVNGYSDPAFLNMSATTCTHTHTHTHSRERERGSEDRLRSARATRHHAAMTTGPMAGKHGTRAAASRGGRELPSRERAKSGLAAPSRLFCLLW